MRSRSVRPECVPRPPRRKLPQRALPRRMGEATRRSEHMLAQKMGFRLRLVPKARFLCFPRRLASAASKWRARARARPRTPRPAAPPRRRGSCPAPTSSLATIAKRTEPPSVASLPTPSTPRHRERGSRAEGRASAAGRPSSAATGRQPAEEAPRPNTRQILAEQRHTTMLAVALRRAVVQRHLDPAPSNTPTSNNVSGHKRTV